MAIPVVGRVAMICTQVKGHAAMAFELINERPYCFDQNYHLRVNAGRLCVGAHIEGRKSNLGYRTVDQCAPLHAAIVALWAISVAARPGTWRTFVRAVHWRVTPVLASVLRDYRSLLSLC